MIGLVDYGVGNILAFHNVYERLAIPCKIITSPQDIATVEKLILPGVGSFDNALQKLRAAQLEDALTDAVLKNNKPVLGVCVGLQIMAKSSAEGTAEGLGWLDTEVTLVQPPANNTLPHMGWNTLDYRQDHPLFEGFPAVADVYFLHSYKMNESADFQLLATATYGETLPAVVQKDNIYGIQAHPEKSHAVGQLLLRNFATFSV